MDIGAVFRRLARSRWIAATVGAAVLLAWAFFLHRQLQAIQHYPWHIPPIAPLLAIGLGACYFAGLALCWAFLLRRVALEQHVSLAAAVRVWLLSMMTRYIPGNVWHIVSRVALAHQLGVNNTQVFTSAAVEQVLTLLGALALFGCTLPFWRVGTLGRTWLLVLVPLGLLMLHPRVLGQILIWLATKTGRAQFAWRYTYCEIVILVAAYMLPNLCAGMALSLLVWGMSAVSLADLPLLFGAAALAWVIGYLSFFTPSGLGIREAVLVTLLSQLYPTPVALFASLLFRVVLTIGEMLAVGSAWAAGTLARRRLMQQQR